MRYILFFIAVALRYPTQSIALVVMLMVLVGLATGLNAVATATGLGAAFYVLVGVALVVAVLLIRGRVAEQKARGRAAEDERRARERAAFAPLKAYLALAARWELATVEPGVVIAEIRAWRTARAAGQQRFRGRWEDRMLLEAEEATASGVCPDRDARTERIRAWRESNGLNVPKDFNDIGGCLYNVAPPPGFISDVTLAGLRDGQSQAS